MLALRSFGLVWWVLTEKFEQNFEVVLGRIWELVEPFFRVVELFDTFYVV